MHNGLIKIEKFKHATNFIVERSVFSITYRATTVKRLPKENKKIVLNETNDRFKTNSVLTISALTKNYRSRRQLERLYGGQFTPSTQFIKPNILQYLPTDAAPQFL